MLLRKDLKVVTLPKGMVLKLYDYSIILIEDTQVHCPIPIVQEKGLEALHKMQETMTGSKRRSLVNIEPL